MATQIIVTLITALGGLLCALVASRRKSSKDVTTEFVSEQLKRLTDYSARVRLAAKIAYRGCKDNMRTLRRVGSLEVSEASGVFRVFDEELRRLEDGKIDTGAHVHLRTYDRFVEEFRDALRNLCERLAERPRVTDPPRMQWLESDLNRLRTLLDQMDEQFQFSINGYLSGPGAVLPSGARRRLLNDMQRFYRRRIPVAQVAPDGGQIEPPRPVAAPLGAPGDTQSHSGPYDDPSPPCGHCVWRCPHAPAFLEAGGVGASDPGDASPHPAGAPDTGRPSLGAGRAEWGHGPVPLGDGAGV
ncbi:hypothetical protein [Streptomyces sp. NPDC058954]|uniref:hypothetical protein n=1 Tax=Streptomyces sp. NPDC058954 TaxID=3346677 RepID=UPI0036CD1963